MNAAEVAEELIQRIIDVLRADDRVRATWLSGSLGRWAGDRYSDVDLVAIVAQLPGSSCHWRGTCPSGRARHGRMRWKARCAPIWTASWA